MLSLVNSLLAHRQSSCTKSEEEPRGPVNISIRPLPLSARMTPELAVILQTRKPANSISPSCSIIWIRNVDEPLLLGASCVICLIIGATLAGVAPYIPAHAATLERLGGVLLVIGLALLGVLLHLSR